MTRTPDTDTPDRTPPPRVSGATANWLGYAFYAAVAVVAYAGQVNAATEWLRWPTLSAALAVAVLELGGIALAARADFRRRLNETALASRALSAAVAVFAVVFNWLGHAHVNDRLAGAFFAGMSALGYGVWLINSGDRRRDQLRAERKLPPPPPSYDLWQWIWHPWTTWRARGMAKADPNLGTYGSLRAAEQTIRAEKRTAAIAKVLHRRLRAAVDPVTADIAVLTYDLDEIAVRLAASADYDGLTAIIAADLAPEKLTTARDTEAPAPVEPPAAQTVTQAPDTTVVVPIGRSDRTRPRRPVRAEVRPAAPQPPTVEQLADILTERFGRDYVGKPKALEYLRTVYGSCATDRAIEAKDIHNARRERATTGQPDSADDKEHDLVGASA